MQPHVPPPRDACVHTGTPCARLPAVHRCGQPPIWCRTTAHPSKSCRSWVFRNGGKYKAKPQCVLRPTKFTKGFAAPGCMSGVMGAGTGTPGAFGVAPHGPHQPAAQPSTCPKDMKRVKECLFFSKPHKGQMVNVTTASADECCAQCSLWPKKHKGVRALPCGSWVRTGPRFIGAR